MSKRSATQTTVIIVFILFLIWGMGLLIPETASLSQPRALVSGTVVENSPDIRVVRTNTNETISVQSDIPVTANDRVFVESTTIDDVISWDIVERNRIFTLLASSILFIGIVITVLGVQLGIRSLGSLTAGLCIILWVLVPGLLSGISPLPFAISITTIIVGGSILATHGWNRVSLSAIIGTTLSVTLTGFLAHLITTAAKFTGYGSDEAVYLATNLTTPPNPQGILMAGILIAILGVLDDIAVTQAAVVRELKHLNPHLSYQELFTRSMRVGREHAGALVNTLTLAYTGSSLSLILLQYTSHEPIGFILSREFIATEITRTLVGSIGVLLAVPITTAVAVFLIRHTDSYTHSHTHH